MQAKKGEISAIAIRVILLSAAIAAILAAIAFFTHHYKAALSIGAGAGIGSLSFLALVVTISGAANPGRMGVRKGLLAALGLLKIAAVGALLWWLIFEKIVDPIPFLVGFGAVVLSLVVEGIRAGRAMERAG
ncbi:MAG: ATP synthase subunit I [bacterium]